MRAIVNPLHDPHVDALWAEADGLGGPSRKFMRAMIQRARRGKAPVSAASKIQRAVMMARQRGGAKAALKVARFMRRRRKLKAVPRRRRRRVGWQRAKLDREATHPVPGRRAPFGMAPARFRQLCRQYEGGLSGIECDELETLAGFPEDEPYTLGDLGGFFSKIKKAVKKIHKKTFKVLKKVVKSKAFKIAAIGAAAWFAGPLIIAKLAAKKGITVALARAALKRGAQRLGKTGAVTVGASAATNAAPAPEQAVDYDAILELGMQADGRAAAQLAPTIQDTRTMGVPGEVGGPKLAGFGAMGAIVIGGGLLTALMMGGGPRRR